MAGMAVNVDAILGMVEEEVEKTLVTAVVVVDVMGTTEGIEEAEEDGDARGTRI